MIRVENDGQLNVPQSTVFPYSESCYHDEFIEAVSKVCQSFEPILRISRNGEKDAIQLMNKIITFLIERERDALEWDEDKEESVTEKLYDKATLETLQSATITATERFCGLRPKG